MLPWVSSQTATRWCRTRTLFDSPMIYWALVSPMRPLEPCKGAAKSGCWLECPNRYIIAGDEIAPYLVVMNSHDGKSCAMCPYNDFGSKDGRF